MMIWQSKPYGSIYEWISVFHDQIYNFPLDFFWIWLKFLIIDNSGFKFLLPPPLPEFVSATFKLVFGSLIF
jgi:hypothetical protein